MPHLLHRPTGPRAACRRLSRRAAQHPRGPARAAIGGRMSARGSDSVDQLVAYLGELTAARPKGLAERVQQVVVREESERIVRRLAEIESDTLDGLELVEGLDLLAKIRGSMAVRETLWTVGWDAISRRDPRSTRVVLDAIDHWLDAVPRRAKATMRVYFDAELAALGHRDLIDRLVSLVRAGWEIAVGYPGSSSLGALDI